MTRVGVVGTTSWGTTLGILLARQGHQVTLWARSDQEARELTQARENKRLLPDVLFPPTLTATSDAQVAFSDVELIILCTPSQRLRENLPVLRPHLQASTVLLSAIKGLEKGSGKRMTQVIREELPDVNEGQLCVLSGPNLSKEVVEAKPSSTVVAGHDPKTAEWMQELYNSQTFRVYTNDDVIGVELGGALKNAIAIGVGISDGLGHGANGKAAFVTRGLAEITRLSVACGAKPLTMSGLAGLGDMIATCFSNLSRNRYVGEQIGLGHPLSEVLGGMVHVAEGVSTTEAALQLAKQHGVEMPITELTSRILFEGLDPKEATASLLSRAPAQEWPTDLLR
jgi:glycerol-3-phosphate dehydrogenase (NAD(P)+)